MVAQRALPRFDPIESANDRFKDRFRSFFWSSIIFATLVHVGVFAYWPELTAEDFSFTTEELVAVEIPLEIEIPQPPENITRPATPVVASADVSEDITIAPTTFEMNPVDELPPPPELTKELDISSAPTFTPFTVAPDILNRAEIVEAMERNYPALLRDSGIGGDVRVFFFIDAEGTVQDTRIDQSSGHQLLDDAALEIANMYRFSPALNRDVRVPVWVSFRIRFTVG